MAEGRGNAERIMLFEIVVDIPSLLMSEIAWCVRVAVALTCLLVLFAVAIGAVSACVARAEDLDNTRARQVALARARP